MIGRLSILGICGILTLLMLAPFGIAGAVAEEGLVPCETQANPDRCEFDEFIILIQNVINFSIFVVAMPLAAILFGWAGILMFTAGGNEQKISQAKEIFWWVFVGIIIALSAWLVVNAIVSALVKSEYSLL